MLLIDKETNFNFVSLFQYPCLLPGFYLLSIFFLDPTDFQSLTAMANSSLENHFTEKRKVYVSFNFSNLCTFYDKRREVTGFQCYSFLFICRSSFFFVMRREIHKDIR